MEGFASGTQYLFEDHQKGDEAEALAKSEYLRRMRPVPDIE